MKTNKEERHLENKIKILLSKLNLREAYCEVVDYHLNYLIDTNQIPCLNQGGIISKDYEFPETANKYKTEYWTLFVDKCDDWMIDFVLSMPQSGNWNGWLYAACEIKRRLKPNR